MPEVAPGGGRSRGRIDVHQHIYPPHFTKRNIQRLVDDSPDFPASMYLDWSVDQALQNMDKHGTATTIVSLTSPGLWFGDKVAASEAAREFNELAAQMMRDHPSRFGAFAPIPLPDQAASLAEIEHALDRLHLTGIGLISSYEGKLLGDPSFAAVFDDLNRRRATVFVHPVGNLNSHIVNPWVILPTMEFVFDTTRTITSLAASGTFARCPHIKFIFPHAGGAIFMLARRIEAGIWRRLTPQQKQERFPDGMLGVLKTLYFDIVSATNPTAIAAVRTVMPVERLLFGTDHPFVPAQITIEQLGQLGFTPDEQQAIGYSNAAAIGLAPKQQTAKA